MNARRKGTAVAPPVPPPGQRPAPAPPARGPGNQPPGKQPDPPAPEQKTEAPPPEILPWQQTLREKLEPVTDWMPAEVRDIMPVEACWLVLLVVLLSVLLIVGTILKKLGNLT